MRNTLDSHAGLDSEVQEVARALYRSAARHKPSLFEPRDWLGKMIEWSLRDESLRTALFRFVDVLPSLRSAGDVGRHLEEYFSRVDHAFGGLVFLAQALHAGWIFAPIVRQNVVHLARRFIAEDDRESLRRVLESLRAEPAAFTLDVVGEATVSDKEALATQCRYLDLLQNLTSIAAGWPTVPQIDQGERGLLPKVNLSVKISSLCARFDPLDPESVRSVTERLRPLFREAARLHAGLTVDMEQYAFKDLTLAIFRELLDESEFASEPHATIAIQAYLLDAEKDVQSLIDWARASQRRLGIRLVKGAYWDSEIAWARQKGWPVPVFLDKAETDANYERLSRLLLQSSEHIDPAFASHNIRSIAHAIVTAKRLGLAAQSYEIQTLYGMGEPIRHAVIQNGQRVRVYLPTGRLLPGMAYLIRRLMENTSNTSFLRQVYVEEAGIEKLIATPRAKKRPNGRPQRSRKSAGAELAEPFRNEPPLDFSRGENRDRFAQALLEVRKHFGRSFPLVISGETIETGRWLESVNPAAPNEIVGRTAEAGREQADRALEAASLFFPRWRSVPARERAEVLIRAAEVMRRKRFELASWEVFEVGKGWREADADVVEAIDYLEYYARQALRLAEPRRTQEVPGETNLSIYEARGVATIIAPWNFPLAILTGMTAAALATGNCAVVKPAEQSPVMGALLMEILGEAGLPERACQLLQGGGQLGAYLVRHSAVQLIAFTGSREAGLDILRSAYDHQPGQEHVKRVICEMGGKNAIIVDADADLDEAIQHIVESAFGYQGQKCSAASRLILLDPIHDVVLERLVEAALSLRIGPPEDPRNFLGPVIERAARDRVLEYSAIGKQEGTCLLEREAPAQGYFVGPAIFSAIASHHRIANEEIFGPVLAVLRARDFDDALNIALRSSYGLTGGLFSRSPAHIEKTRREFRVGNLYINRGITGAIVERQPFGGLKLSGIGSKAGGPDYLLQFVEPRTISENTLRHGFVPPQELRMDTRRR